MSGWDTYLVTQESLSGERSTVEVVEAAIAGGIDVVQLREKGATARERYHLGRELRELTRNAGVRYLVNDRADIALAVGADGVHLGDEDLPVAAARELLGESATIGRSVSFVEGARRAERAGADYLGVGAVYDTRSKEDIPDAESAVGPARVEAIAAAVDIPVIAIGGITSDNAAAVVEAGADSVAVITAITGADDPEAATSALRRAVAAARESRGGSASR